MLLQAFDPSVRSGQLMERLELDLLTFAGSSAWALTIELGITGRFPRTASGCWRAISPPSC